MLTLLTASVIAVAVALAAVSVTSIIRAVPAISSRAKRGIKPWACNTCMAWWTSGLAVAVAMLLSRDPWNLVLWFPAHGLAVMLLQRLSPAPFIEALKE